MMHIFILTWIKLCPIQNTSDSISSFIFFQKFSMEYNLILDFIIKDLFKSDIEKKNQLFLYNQNIDVE